MNFLKRLFGSNPREDGRFLTLYALSHRCKEPLTGRVDLLNELSLDEEGDATYFTRKVLHTSGQDRCFASVEISLWFDGRKQVVQEEISGGRRLDEAQYAEALARFHAPPEEEAEAAKNDAPPTDEAAPHP